MKVYRKRNSSKIKTLMIAMASGKSSKCGLAAEHHQIKLSIVGIFFLMMIVQCIGATGTYINSFYRDLFLCFSFMVLLLPRTRNERRNFSQNNFLEVIVKHVNFVMNSFVS